MGAGSVQTPLMWDIVEKIYRSRTLWSSQIQILWLCAGGIAEDQVPGAPDLCGRKREGKDVRRMAGRGAATLLMWAKGHHENCLYFCVFICWAIYFLVYFLHNLFSYLFSPHNQSLNISK